MVTRVVLYITADNQTKIAGDANPVLTVTYLGFVNNEGPGNLVSQPVVSTTAANTSPVGVYTINVGGALSDNYIISYTDGTLTVTRANPLVAIPNTFTPNGDGVNDLWEISSLSAYPQCTIFIYTRYGNLIYRSIAYSKPWDGTYQGNPVPSGTYYYLIDLKNGTKELAGPITVTR